MMRWLVLSILCLPCALAAQSVEVSYYADAHHGKPTASGERFDMNALTAAHRSLPFGTVVELTHVPSGRSVRLYINDRGPYVKGRAFDVSLAAAKVLGILKAGKASCTFRIIHGVQMAKRGGPLAKRLGIP